MLLEAVVQTFPRHASPIVVKSRPDRMAAAFEAASPPSGPTSLAELMAWPDEAVKALLADDKKASTLGANFGSGCVLRTLYSGYDNPSVAFHSLRRALRRHGHEVGPCIVAHTADIAESRRKILMEWDKPTRAAHVFGDILDRLTLGVRAEVESMMPNYGDIRTCSDARKQRSMVLAAAAKYKQIAELLDKAGPSLFNQSTESYCYLHQKRCRCCTFEHPASTPGMLTWVVAGSNCQAWSTRGLQLGVAHPSFLVWLVFAQEWKQMRPDIWLHEITPNFPHGLFSYVLGGEYRISMYQDMCPTMLGHPVRRPRQYLVGHRVETVRSCGTQEDFKNVFSRRVAMSGAAYFVAPSSEVHSMLEKRAKKRRISYDAEAGDISFDDILPPGKRVTLRSLLKDCEEVDGGSDVVLDLEVSPGFRTKPTSIIPCLVANSEIYSTKMGRSAVPKEHLLMMGMPVYNQEIMVREGGNECEDGSVNRGFSCPFGSALQELSDREVVSMAGNGMHVAVVGALISYIMATTKKLDCSTIDGESFCGDCGLDGGVHLGDGRVTWEEALGSGRNPYLRDIARPLISLGSDPLDDDLGDRLDS